MSLTVMIALALTVVMLGAGVPQLWRSHRCQKKGHRWFVTDEGIQCQRCKHLKREGDYL